MSSYSVGFAAFVNDRIDLDTVSSTERAAMVNYIVRAGIMVTSTFTDEHIAGLFRQMVNARREMEPVADVAIAMVRIERLLSEGSASK